MREDPSSRSACRKRLPVLARGTSLRPTPPSPPRGGRPGTETADAEPSTEDTRSPGLLAESSESRDSSSHAVPDSSSPSSLPRESGSNSKESSCAHSSRCGSEWWTAPAESTNRVRCSPSIPSTEHCSPSSDPHRIRPTLPPPLPAGEETWTGPRSLAGEFGAELSDPRQKVRSDLQSSGTMNDPIEDSSSLPDSLPEWPEHSHSSSIPILLLGISL